MDNKKNNTNPAFKSTNFDQFAGSTTCASCHKDIYNKHIQTAHFLTSGIANEKTIKGSFDTGKNRYTYSDGSSIIMEKTDTGFFQVAYVHAVEKKRQKFDLVMGSGTKGQSYAAWVKDKLVQMPITYFTSAAQWSNSPGDPDKIAFNRPVSSRCMECHSTFAEKISDESADPESFDKNHLILGVDCEKCHGPAKAHVDFQTKNPAEKAGKFIINPARFTRQQSLDMCAVCHGGRIQKTKPSFSFTAGDKLSDFFKIDTAAKDAESIDVHGNQSGLMAASKCFRNSQTLTCVTCHNTHENEKGKTAVFSQRCITCHSSTDTHGNGVLCKMTGTISPALIKTNCIDCHMPEQQSMAIAVLLQGASGPSPAKMRSHYIRIYPDETKKVLAFMKSAALVK
jgi:hypothetical protein